MDTYVDDELHLHLCHRLLEVRHPRFLLATLSILRHPNPHSSPVMHHSCMVSSATLYGVFAMSTTHSLMGWRPSNEGRKMPYPRINVFLLDGFDARFDRLRYSYSARH